MRSFRPEIFGQRILPAWTITPRAFGATYTGQKGFGGGVSLGLSTLWKGTELSLDFGKGFFNVYKGPHTIVTLAITFRPKK